MGLSTKTLTKKIHLSCDINAYGIMQCFNIGACECIVKFANKCDKKALFDYK